MTETDFKQRAQKLKAEVNTIVQKAEDEPQILEPIIKEITSLFKHADSAVDVDVLLETLDSATSFIDQKQKNVNQYWKKDLTVLAQGLSKEINVNNNGWNNVQQYFTGIFPNVISNVFYYNGIRSSNLELNVNSNNIENKTQKRKNRTRRNQQQILTRQVEILSQTSSECSSLKIKKIPICIEKLYEVCNYDNNVEVPFFNFAINGKSFVQTVHNIFILSFLVREHHAILSADSNHQLLLRPSLPYEIYKKNEQNKVISSKNTDDYPLSHLIISINTKEWMLLKKALGITSAMLPIMSPETE